MNTQVNVRLPENLLDSARKYSEEHGFVNVQDFIRETMREKLFDLDTLTKKEYDLVMKILKISKEKTRYGTEEELWKALNK